MPSVIKLIVVGNVNGGITPKNFRVLLKAQEFLNMKLYTLNASFPLFSIAIMLFFKQVPMPINLGVGNSD